MLNMQYLKQFNCVQRKKLKNLFKNKVTYKLYIYICVCVCIVIHRDCLVVSQLFSVA